MNVAAERGHEPIIRLIRNRMNFLKKCLDLYRSKHDPLK